MSTFDLVIPATKDVGASIEYHDNNLARGMLGV
jgi:hypothetical protein